MKKAKNKKIKTTKKDIKRLITEMKRVYERMDRNVPFELYKKIIAGGLFTSPTYDYKTVNLWTEMIEAEKSGWSMKNTTNYAINLAQKNRVVIEALLEVLDKIYK